MSSTVGGSEPAIRLASVGTSIKKLASFTTPVCRTRRVTFPAREAQLHDLVDTTEMYLRTILELEEEGVVPLRARIAERLHQSGPTVSQTVARMERDGLVSVASDRHLELTDEGRRLATRVMRKHRLAE